MGRRSESGFTLIELVLVAAILLVLVSLSLPRLRDSFSNLEARNSAFNLRKLIGYAEERATLERSLYRIGFDFDKGRFRLFSLDANGNFRAAPGRYGRAFLVPTALSLKGDKEEWTFYPDGSAEAGKVELLDRAGGGFRVFVKGFGSKVEIEEIFPP